MHYYGVYAMARLAGLKPEAARTAVRLRGLRYKVEPHLPPDVLGIYVYLPAL